MLQISEKPGGQFSFFSYLQISDFNWPEISFGLISPYSIKILPFHFPAPLSVLPVFRHKASGHHLCRLQGPYQ